MSGFLGLDPLLLVIVRERFISQKKGPSSFCCTFTKATILTSKPEVRRRKPSSSSTKKADERHEQDPLEEDKNRNRGGEEKEERHTSSNQDDNQPSSSTSSSSMLSINTIGPLAPGPRPSSSSRPSPALAELLVVNAVVAWVCAVLVLDKPTAHKIEALLLLLLGLAAHAGIGPSQFRFAPDSGMAVGLTAVPAMLASLYLISHHNATLGSLLHASLICALGVAIRQFFCVPISDIPSRSTNMAWVTAAVSKLCLLTFRILLPWPVAAFLFHEIFMWGLVELPLFTASFTLGEAMIITQALALASADAFCCTALRAGLTNMIVGSALRTDRDPVLLVLQLGLIGALGSGFVILPLFCHDFRERRDGNGVLQSSSFYHYIKSSPVIDLLTTPPASSEITSPSGGPSSAAAALFSSSSNSSTGGRVPESKGVIPRNSSNNNNINNKSSSGSTTTAKIRTVSGNSSDIINHHPHDHDASTSLSVAAAAAPLSSSSSSSAFATSSILPMAIFAGVFVAYVGLVLLPWLGFMIRQNPITWVFEFLTEDPGRVKLCILWAVLLLLFTQAVVPLSEALKLRRIMVRKLFHFLAVIMFAPATHKQPKLLALSYAVALSVLVVLEYIRMSRSSLPIGALIHRYYSHFLDERDMGNLVVTHIYLLLGCSFPLWISWLPKGINPPNPLIPYAGILVLGIGDSAAATVGTYLGSHRWPGSNRTLEGSAAMFITLLFATLMVEQAQEPPLMLWGGFKQIGALFLATLLLSLLEAFTTQIDNLVLPIFAVTLFNMAFCLARGLTIISSAASSAAAIDLAAASTAALTSHLPAAL